jgi:hypothetical protein
MISKGKKSSGVLLCGEHKSSMCFGRGFDTQQIKVRLPAANSTKMPDHLAWLMFFRKNTMSFVKMCKFSIND